MNTLGQLVAAELSRPPPAAARAMADAILAEHGDAVACILFYGARRRDGDGDGLLDLYVLFDRHLAYHRRRSTALFNRLLPPNVSFVTIPGARGSVQAKVAVMSRAAFAVRMRAASWDTTIWTRFCQPASLLHARDRQVEAWVAATIAEGLRTAASWSRRFARPGAGAAERWQALFAQTYRLELRPEGSNRSALVYQAAPAWFDAATAITDAEVRGSTSKHSWQVRRLLGKPLNLLRLVKAAFTFSGGAEYLAGKLAKHTGVMISPTQWQRRHPLFGAPALLIMHARRRRQAASRREDQSVTR